MLLRTLFPPRRCAAAYVLPENALGPAGKAAGSLYNGREQDLLLLKEQGLFDLHQQPGCVAVNRDAVTPSPAPLNRRQQSVAGSAKSRARRAKAFSNMCGHCCASTVNCLGSATLLVDVSHSLYVCFCPFNKRSQNSVVIAIPNRRHIDFKEFLVCFYTIIIYGVFSICFFYWLRIF